MKKLIYLFFLLSMYVFGQNLKIMTYNIRYDNPKDGINKWDNRKENLIDLINFYSPDVFGIQEGLFNQVAFLNQNLPNYSFYGIGRDDGKNKGEFSAIYYKKDLFEVLVDSTIWLSSSPEKVSVGWDASMERICSFVLLKHKTKNISFWVFNTHFDHIGKKAQYESAKLISKTVEEVNVNNLPFFLIGDLNVTPEEETIKFLKDKFADSFDISETKPYGQKGTFNNFNYLKTAESRIDYIFTDSKHIGVLKHHTIGDYNNQLFPSDHFPVLIEFLFR